MMITGKLDVLLHNFYFRQYSIGAEYNGFQGQKQPCLFQQFQIFTDF